MGQQQEEELKAKALDLLPGLKTELGEELILNVPDTQLLKFLHWKPDINRAAERFRAHIQWRKANPWAFDDQDLRIKSDEQLKKLVQSQFLIAPSTVVSKDGASVLIGRLRNNNMKDGRTPKEVCRAILYLLDRVLEREGAQINGIIMFHDLQGVGKNNLHPMIPKLLLTAIIGHFPIRIRGLYILNAPLFFKAFFTPIKTVLFPKKLKERTNFVGSIEDIYEVIDQNRLLKEHGGDLDFDVEKEMSKHELHEESDDFESFKGCMP